MAEANAEVLVEEVAPVADDATPSSADGLFQHDEYLEPTKPTEGDDVEPAASEEVDTELSGDAESASPVADDNSSEADKGPNLQELAEQLGEDPEDFESEEELLRWVRRMDKREKRSLPAVETKETETPAKVPAAKPEPEVVVSDLQAEGIFDLKKLREEGYDEVTLKMAELLPALTSKIKTLESKLTEQPNSDLERRLGEWETSQRVAAERQYFETFHTVIDKWTDDKFGRVLDDEGRPGNLDPTKESERRKLYDEMQVINEVEQKYGRNLTVAQLANRARLNLYPNDFKRQLRKEATDKGKARGSKRLGSPTGSSNQYQSIANPAHEEDRTRRELLEYIQKKQSE